MREDDKETADRLATDASRLAARWGAQFRAGTIDDRIAGALIRRMTTPASGGHHVRHADTGIHQRLGPTKLPHSAGSRRIPCDVGSSRRASMASPRQTHRGHENIRICPAHFGDSIAAFLPRRDCEHDVPGALGVARLASALPPLALRNTHAKLAVALANTPLRSALPRWSNSVPQDFIAGPGEVR